VTCNQAQHALMRGSSFDASCAFSGKTYDLNLNVVRMMS